MNKLNRKFFERNPVDVAQDLLGCYFLHKTEKGIIRGKIIETEAYGDANDLASHARFGSSIRNRIMFGKAGILYVYHIYGIFYLTNIICEKEGTPGAVLIRSVEVTEGKDLAITNLESSKFVKINEQIATGPGKFSMAFGIGKKDNGKDITQNQSLIYIQERDAIPEIVSRKRVGIDYAGHCKDLLWRFYIKESNLMSRK